MNNNYETNHLPKFVARLDMYCHCDNDNHHKPNGTIVIDNDLFEWPTDGQDLELFAADVLPIIFKSFENTPAHKNVVFDINAKIQECLLSLLKNKQIYRGVDDKWRYSRKGVI